MSELNPPVRVRQRVMPGMVPSSIPDPVQQVARPRSRQAVAEPAAPRAPAKVEPRKTVPAPDVWPSGAELYEQGTRKLIGITVRQPDGSYHVWKVQMVDAGEAKDHVGALALLAR